MDRRRKLDRGLGTRVGDHRRKLLGEQRIALGCRRDAQPEIPVLNPERLDE
jgi:hypothetical protein